MRRFERHENVNVSTLEESYLRTHPKIILQRKPSIRSGAFGVYSEGEPARMDFFISQTRAAAGTLHRVTGRLGQVALAVSQV